MKVSYRFSIRHVTRGAIIGTTDNYPGARSLSQCLLFRTDFMYPIYFRLICDFTRRHVSTRCSGRQLGWRSIQGQDFPASQLGWYRHDSSLHHRCLRVVVCHPRGSTGGLTLGGPDLSSSSHVIAIEYPCTRYNGYQPGMPNTSDVEYPPETLSIYQKYWVPVRNIGYPTEMLNAHPKTEYPHNR